MAAIKKHTWTRTELDDRGRPRRVTLAAFGAALPVRALTATAIAQYEQRRIGQVSAFTVCNELTVLRHMLRLGKRWGYLDEVSEITMPKKPIGRLRYLDEAEITRLLAA